MGTLQLGEVKEDGRAVSFVGVKEGKPSENPALQEGRLVESDKDKRRRKFLGQGILLKIETIKKGGSVLYTVEQKGKTRRARTGMKVDAIQAITQDLRDAIFQNEGDGLVGILKAIRQMQRTAGENSPVQPFLHVLAIKVSFRFARLGKDPELRFDQLLDTISNLAGLPDLPAARIMARVCIDLKKYGAPGAVPTRIGAHQIAKCLGAVGSLQDKKEVRELLGDIANAFDWGYAARNPIDPNTAFEWVETSLIRHRSI